MINWERMYSFKDLISYYQKIIKIRKRLNNFYRLNRVKYYNLYDLPKGLVGFDVQRILYGDFAEIIIIFNSSETDYTYNINKKGDWFVILGEHYNEEENKEIYLENNIFVINAISTGIIGLKDD